MNKDNMIEHVIEKTKDKIAIYNYEKNKKNYHFNKITSRVAIFLVCLCIISYVSHKAITYTYIKSQEQYATIGIKNAKENGYIENVEMDYIYSDGIGLKIKSLILSDTDVNIDFQYNIQKKLNCDEGTNLEFSFIVYDENNNIYYCGWTEDKKNILKEFCKERNVKYEPEYLMDNMLCNGGLGGNIAYTETGETTIQLISKEKLKESKKIYIKIKGFGYTNDTGKYIKCTNSEWNLEIEVPQIFKNRNSIEYELAEKIEGVTLQKAILSETSMNIVVNIEGINEVISVKEYDGKYSRMYCTHIGNKVYINFDINKYIATDEIEIVVKTQRKEIPIRLKRVN